jgi:nucleotide-binding universal stress UspA family protein
MTTKMKILIAYDGSTGSDAALHDLRRAGLPDTAEALVISVDEQWLPVPTSYWMMKTSFSSTQPASGKAQARAEQAAEQVRSLFPNWQVNPEFYGGSPASVILAKAEEWQPDLIVVGSHGHTALGRFFLGSVSQKIVTESNDSVRVARRSTTAPDAPARLVVGIDGSPYAEAALQAIVARQWPRGSEVKIVHAEFKLPPQLATELGEHENATMQMAEWIAENNHRIRQMIETAEGQLQAAGMKTSVVVKEEDPKRLLLAEAESFGADCIFVGARGLSRLERAWLGSVSTAIIGRAHCSVEVRRVKE